MKCYILNDAGKVINAIKASKQFCEDNNLRYIISDKEIDIGDYYKNRRFVKKIAILTGQSPSALKPLSITEIENILNEIE